MDADFLVIGSGLAGLTFALRAARHGAVLVLSKDRLPESATNYAQGGIASVWSPEDSFEAHVEDTLIAGAGLCHRDMVEQIVIHMDGKQVPDGTLFSHHGRKFRLPGGWRRDSEVGDQSVNSLGESSEPA
jgi:aspartate oxidase